MPNEPKSLVQSLEDLENRLRRKRADVATQRAKLRERCARLLFEKCPDEMRQLVEKYVADEDWKRFKRLGFDDHLPLKMGVDHSGTTPENQSVVPEYAIRDLFDHPEQAHG
jgi:hypothetical protein